MNFCASYFVLHVLMAGGFFCLMGHTFRFPFYFTHIVLVHRRRDCLRLDLGFGNCVGSLLLSCFLEFKSIDSVLVLVDMGLSLSFLSVFWIG